VMCKAKNGNHHKTAALGTETKGKEKNRTTVEKKWGAETRSELVKKGGPGYKKSISGWGKASEQASEEKKQKGKP